MTENNEKSTEAQKNDHRSTPKASAFTEFIAKDWAKAEDDGYTLSLIHISEPTRPY